MANEWLRLWHDMPNDPKWRTIARISGQPVSLVQAIYVHLLVDASRNVTRGHVTVTKEDIASALDLTEEQVESVFSAMQGRVLEGDKLTGWEGRQPKREDIGSNETGAKSAAQRKREQRERAKKEQEENTGHVASRNVTTDKDKDKEVDQKRNVDAERQPGDDDPDSGNRIPGNGTPPCPAQAIVEIFHKALPELPSVAILTDTRRKHLQSRWRESPVHQDLQFWVDYFTHVRNSQFLMGKASGRDGGKPFRATFDWLIAPSNFVKVIEGNYNA